jgi:hypothetical protein
MESVMKSVVVPVMEDEHRGKECKPTIVIPRIIGISAIWISIIWVSAVRVSIIGVSVRWISVIGVFVIEVAITGCPRIISGGVGIPGGP